MKRVTILFDDENLYRQVKTEAAKEGRSVKDIVAEALNDWLRRRTTISTEQQRRRQEALRMSRDLLAQQPVSETIEETLEAIRLERS